MYPKSVQELVQIDYAHKLNLEEQNWLRAFNEAHFGSNPICLEKIVPGPISQEEKRRLWRELKRRERGYFAVRDLISHTPLEHCKVLSHNPELWMQKKIDRKLELSRIMIQDLKRCILIRYP
jgi:hypothetical protein